MSDYVYVAVIGLVLGVAELLSRYRDEPLAMLRQAPAGLYVLLNAVIAILALLLLRNLIKDGAVSTSLAQRWGDIVTAGVGGMMLFRSSLFVARIKDQDVDIGPGWIIKILLDVVDRQVDRRRAADRAVEVTEIMKDVDFAKAHQSLPAMCFTLMQNVPAGEAELVGKQISALNASAIPLSARSTMIGLLLSISVGTSVLRAAKASLGKAILIDPAP